MGQLYFSRIPTEGTEWCELFGSVMHQIDYAHTIHNTYSTSQGMHNPSLVMLMLCICVCQEAGTHLHTFDIITITSHHSCFKDRGFLNESPVQSFTHHLGTANATPKLMLPKVLVINLSSFPMGYTKHNHIRVVYLQKKLCSLLRALKGLEKTYCHRSLGSPKNVWLFYIIP